MMSRSEREHTKQIIRDEIESHRQKYDNAQLRYAYGSRSAERTMDKHQTLEHALEAYLNSMDGRDSRMEKLIAIDEAIRNAEKQIELYGEKSLSVRVVIARIRRIVNGGEIHG